MVGENKVRYNNDYKVRIVTPLWPGVYKFYLRAVDQVGHLGHLSRPFLIKVVPKKHHSRDNCRRGDPKGPQASS